MTAMLPRTIITAGFMVGAGLLIATLPDNGISGVVRDYFWLFAVTIVALAAVVDVRDRLGRRQDQDTHAGETTAMQVLPADADDQPATLHFPEGGER